MQPNVTRAVPFFWVRDLASSLRFYVDGLGFTMTRSWKPDGKLRWCWLQLGDAGLMLQEYLPARVPDVNVSEGVSICFQCKDALALFHDFIVRGLKPRQPFVGNGLWVVSVTDPDGYKLDFESFTDAPEESLYTG